MKEQHSQNCIRSQIYIVAVVRRRQDTLSNAYMDHSIASWLFIKLFWNRFTHTRI